MKKKHFVKIGLVLVCLMLLVIPVFSAIKTTNQPAGLSPQPVQTTAGIKLVAGGGSPPTSQSSSGQNTPSSPTTVTLYVGGTTGTPMTVQGYVYVTAGSGKYDASLAVVNDNGILKAIVVTSTNDKDHPGYIVTDNSFQMSNDKTTATLVSGGTFDADKLANLQASLNAAGSGAHLDYNSANGYVIIDPAGYTVTANVPSGATTPSYFTFTKGSETKYQAPDGTSVTFSKDNIATFSLANGAKVLYAGATDANSFFGNNFVATKSVAQAEYALTGSSTIQLKVESLTTNPPNTDLVIYDGTNNANVLVSKDSATTSATRVTMNPTNGVITSKYSDFVETTTPSTVKSGPTTVAYASTDSAKPLMSIGNLQSTSTTTTPTADGGRKEVTTVNLVGSSTNPSITTTLNYDSNGNLLKGGTVTIPGVIGGIAIASGQNFNVGSDTFVLDSGKIKAVGKCEGSCATTLNGLNKECDAATTALSLSEMAKSQIARTHQIDARAQAGGFSGGFGSITLAGAMQTIDELSASAQAFQGTSNLFMSKQALASYQLQINKLFTPFTTTGWAESICSQKFKQPAQQTAFVKVAGNDIIPAATVGGECAPALDSFTGVTTHLYTFTVFVSNPQSTNNMTSMNFNVELYKADGTTVDMFTKKQSLTVGQSFTLDKSKRPVFSSAIYTKICVQFDEPPQFFKGTTVCNAITCSAVPQSSQYDSLPTTTDPTITQLYNVTAQSTNPDSTDASSASILNPNI